MGAFRVIKESLKHRNRHDFQIYNLRNGAEISLLAGFVWSKQRRIKQREF